MMKKPFSIWLYLFIVILLSWPFQFWYVFKAETAFDKYFYSSLSMVMVAVATFVAGRFVFKDGFAGAGWSWGKPIHYIVVLLFALFVWFVPSMVELIAGIHKPVGKVAATNVVVMFVLRFAVRLLPAFGEEFGWRDICYHGLQENMVQKKGCSFMRSSGGFAWWILWNDRCKECSN